MRLKESLADYYYQSQMTQTAMAEVAAASSLATTFTDRGPHMKLRFEIDQSECFRRGIDCPRSIITIEVNPAKVPAPLRDLIADRLDGIDVCRGYWHTERKVIIPHSNWNEIRGGSPDRITAAVPTFEALLEAVVADQKRFEREIGQPVDVEALRALIPEALKAGPPTKNTPQ